MADIFVDSAAAGLNNGTSWANAYTSLGSTTGAAAGDTVYVDDGHSENISSTTTWTWTNGTADNPVRIYCVDKATNLKSTGAALVVTANVTLSLVGGTFMHGFNVTLGDQLTLAAVSSFNRQEFEFCTFSLAATGSNRRISINSSSTNGVHVVFRDCTFNFDTNTVSGTTIVVQCYGTVEFYRGVVKVGTAASQIFLPSSRNHRLYLESVDLSQSPETNLISTTLANLDAHFNRCKLPSGYSYNGPPGANGRFVMERCAVGSLSAPPLGVTLWATREGTVESTTSPYRTGGADDGAQVNGHSWKMAGNAQASALVRPLPGPPITKWVAAGASITATLYVASGVTLKDDEFWVDITGPAGSSPAYANDIAVTKRAGPTDTPQNLATDGTSTWNGSGVGTKQKISHTFTPAISGPVTFRPFLARAVDVYIDPRIEVV